MAPLPRVVVITDWGLPDLLDRVDALCRAHGADIALQHRAPGLPVRAYLERARALAARCGAHGTPLFVSGRLDVALLCAAHLHLPEEAPAPPEVRPSLPPDRWISVAIHEETPPGRARGADVALVSPVFAPGSKPDDTRQTLGADGFARAAARLPCPAYALGGISVETARGLRGVPGVAAISGVLAAEDPAAACAALLEALR
ncbi:MAG: thiamine phosphate synthase [Deltaproteobacteria bacterium]|nr:thiamine phosphate synthase [Deltaproteobacteria bacterium]